jgi:hypothetical protein
MATNFCSPSLLPWRCASGRLGEVYEVGLNAYTGQRNANRWAAILAGEASLLAPVPARGENVRKIVAANQTTFRRQGPDGRFNEIGPHESLWSKP